MAKLAVFLLALGGVAHAAPKPKPAQQQVTEMVETICLSSQSFEVFKKQLHSDAALLVSSIEQDLSKESAGLALFTLHPPKKVTVAFGAKNQSAWFQASCVGKATYKHNNYECERTKDPKCDPYKVTMHVSGLATLDSENKWKAALLAITPTDDNGLMISRGDNPGYPKHEMPTTVEQLGDPDLAKAVAGWFASGKLGKHAAKGTVFAAGSAPAELGSGAAAQKLVATWDKMKLGLVTADAKIVGERGVVQATVRFATKKKTIIQLGLTIFAVKEGETWKWVVLDFVT